MNNQEINDFIIKVFNYYNGKINIINKAVLDINWANLATCTDGGYSRLPNIIVINPAVINRFYGNNEFKTKICIIETIIHELYHTDQLINYKLYVSDISYHNFIEHACEVQTAIYIAGHMKEIFDVFGVNGTISKAYHKCIEYWDLPGITYIRRYYHDHIFMCIDDMCGLDITISSDIYNFIKNNIENKYDIILIINNEQFNICLNNNLLHIDEFNKIISKYICTGLHGVSHQIEYNKNSKKLTINMETEVLNLMCKKV